MSSDEILLEAEEKMIKTEQVVVNEFAGVRTGKASASLIENLLVEVYGSQSRLRELAGISSPEARQLLVQGVVAVADRRLRGERDERLGVAQQLALQHVLPLRAPLEQTPPL